MGANKTRIVISESAMVKETAAFEVMDQTKCNEHFEVHQNIAIPQ